MAEGGVSSFELSNAISQLRSELRGELRAGLNEVRRELHFEIQRLEEEMRQVGDMIVRAIEGQTLAVVETMAANTALMAAAKERLEEDFGKALGKLDSQIESTLQIEVGKKVGEANAIRDKVRAFIGDIRSRFDRSIVTSAQNRELYNVAFRNLTDEYGGKIRSIGAHIFQIRVDDIAPAARAAEIPFEEVHRLPIEMDLRRLEVRAAGLDETLTMLKSSRLDEVLGSMDALDAELTAAAAEIGLPSMDATYCVEGIVTASEAATEVRVGQVAEPVGADLDVRLSLADPGFSPFNTDRPSRTLEAQLAAARFRPLTADERAALAAAADNLNARGLISADATALFREFIASNSLNYLEA